MLRKRYKNHPEWFRSNKICFLDTALGNIWSMRYKDFQESSPSEDGGGRKLPGGAWDYFAGELPQYAQSQARWGYDVDDIYLPLNVKKNHWVALWISLPKRHITVWDSIVGHCTLAELKKLVEPISVMVPYLIRTACDAEDRHKWPLTQFSVSRWPASKVPQLKISGDCGVYCLKYIECHALGYEFSAASLCDANINHIREKLAAEIFDETPFRGGDMATYEGLDAYD